MPIFDITPTLFSDEVERFYFNLHRLSLIAALRDGLSRHTEYFADALYFAYRNTYRKEWQIQNDIKDDTPLRHDEFKKVIADSFDTADDAATLYHELKYFNAKFQFSENEPLRMESILNAPQDLNKNSVKDGLEIGETIHDSIEKFIGKLPPWLKKLMHGISEVLKIAKVVI